MKRKKKHSINKHLISSKFLTIEAEEKEKNASRQVSYMPSVREQNEFVVTAMSRSYIQNAAPQLNFRAV